MNKFVKVNSDIGHFAVEGKFGEVTIFTIDHLSANLDIAIPFKMFILDEIENGLRKIIVDLTYVNYMDSTFVGALIVVLKKLGIVNGKLKLVLKKDSAIKFMLDLTSINKIFDTYFCIEDAKLDFLELKQNKSKYKN